MYKIYFIAPKSKTESFTGGSFHEILHFRRTEARKSILVQLDTDNSTAECKRYCEKYGKIAKLFHYISRLESVRILANDRRFTFT